ncbi:Bug family tripartite tricarboxylate transporter substrate binding protein [Falsiroseomonas sp. HW251]|uniref:Bug family tripartite tricarboxylate transporter substrate binding protein n=1 Tax=Falsiroseomonas sp. HW251 TaxID=3390998 RepID=UPI003D316203
MITMLRRGCLGVMAALFGALAPVAPAGAQAWPDRPVRLIIPFPPGGGTDVVARVAAQCMNLGQPIVIDNRAGAGGTIGTEAAAKAPADGYTLVSLTLSSAVLNTFLYNNLGFDTRRDLAAVAEIGRSPNIVTVRPNFPARDVRGLIEHARANPERVTYSSGGNGTIVHMSSVLFANMAGVRLQHVPFRGGGPALQSVMAGQVDLMIDALPVVGAAVRDGSIRGLAVTAAQRLPQFPDLPTVAESGLPGYETQNWFGIFAPARTPRAVVDRVAAEVARIARDPACRARLTDIGVEPTGLGPEPFTAFWDQELATWGPIVRDSGARVE